MGNPHTDKKRNSSVWIFIGLAIVCSITTWFVMRTANSRLEDTHLKIIEHQQTSTRKVDSLLLVYRKVQVDSLKATQTSLDRLNSQLLNIAETSTINSSNERIANLLESELSKIQNEYEVLNLWCALLTVVFLIFSFFSIFKANEMANQGEDVLRDMRDTERRVEQKSKNLEKEINRINTKISNVSSSVITLEGTQNTLSSKIETMKNTEISALDKRVRDISANMTDLSKNLEQISASYKEVENEFKQLVDTKTLQFNLYADTILKDIDSQIQQLADEKTYASYKEISQSIKNMQGDLRNLIEEFSEITHDKLSQGIDAGMDIGVESDSDDEAGLVDADDQQAPHSSRDRKPTSETDGGENKTNA